MLETSSFSFFWGGVGGECAVEFIFLLRSEAAHLLYSRLHKKKKGGKKKADGGKRERCWLNARTKLVCLHAGWSGILLCFMVLQSPMFDC